MDPFTRNVFLQTRPDPLLGARHSRGAQRRTAQLQTFLKTLQEIAVDRLGTPAGTELVVLNASDWRRLVRYPYGLPFVRTRPKGAGVSILAAADYPPRLLRRFDAVVLRAARAGEAAPGDVREFLDLLVGHEWGHAAANLSDLRSRVVWLDELLATYLFLAALRDSGGATLYDRFLQWARLEVAGSAVERLDLGTFEYPRGRLKFDNALWFQGVFTLRAAELLEARGWEFPQAMRGVHTFGRGEVASLLLEVEPSFREWFMVFSGPAHAVLDD